MGLFANMSGDSSILFISLRFGDVTVWYQSSGCSMGLNGPGRCSDRAYIAAFGPQRAMKILVNRGRLLTAQKKPGEMGDDKKIHKIFLSARIVGSSENLV